MIERASFKMHALGEIKVSNKDAQVMILLHFPRHGGETSSRPNAYHISGFPRCIMHDEISRRKLTQSPLVRLYIKMCADASSLIRTATQKKLAPLPKESPPEPSGLAARLRILSPSQMDVSAKPNPISNLVNSERDAWSDSQTDTRPESRRSPRLDIRPDPRPDTRPDPRPETRPDSRRDSRLDIRPDPRPDTRPDVRPVSERSHISTTKIVQVLTRNPRLGSTKP